MYNYSKLIGKIYEKFGSKGEFYKALGISNATFAKRISSQTSWTQPEMEKTMELIEEPISEIGNYFFNHKV